VVQSQLALDGGQPVLELPHPAWPIYDEDVQEALNQAGRDGSWGRYHGPHMDRLTAALADAHSVRHVLPCCSGTFAVELALRGLHVGASEEVILPGYDFGGNFRAIEAVQARPVLVDILPHTWCLDPERIIEALSPKTRAIIVSHLHGGMADMRTLRAIGDKHNLAIVEDACQSPGAMIQGRMAGTWGDVGVLSFGGSKLLTAGRGGALLTNRDDVAQRVKIFCERGNHAFPLSELQAAVLPPQIRKLSERNAIRLHRAAQLVTSLADLRALRAVRENPPVSVASYFMLAFLYDAVHCGGWPRERFLAAVQAEGAPLDAGFRGFVRRGTSRCRHAWSLEHSRSASDATVILHHPILLESPHKIERLSVAIRKVVDHARVNPQA
jgi:dTDP-4-amino-4,6-dideoxygalactose transaminase